MLESVIKTLAHFLPSAWKSRLKRLIWESRVSRTTVAELYDIHRTYCINPARINLCWLIRSERGRRSVEPAIWERGTVVWGDWDRKVIAFEDMDVWAAFQHRFVQGGRWDETAFYSRILDTIRRGIPKWRCRTAEEVDARFKQIDALFDEIKNEGYRSQLDIDPSMRFGEEDEISVHIGREGDYLFVNGRHRLCIAKILKIDKVPVKVLRRHAKWVSFRKEILAYMEREKAKKLYAPVLHPDLADIPCVHGHDRMEILQAHIPPRSGTVLDLGAHWGYFCHRFEDLGFKCTAIESSPMHAYFMRKLKRAEQKKFDIVEGSVLNLNFADSYDVVLALNIFHHFLKQEDLHTGVIQLLGRLHAGVMFFEPHQPDEPQMQGSFRNYGPEEFVAFVKQHGHFASVSNIGWATNGRPMFKLVR